MAKLTTVHLSVETDEKATTVKCAGETASDANAYKALRLLLDKLEAKDVLKTKAPAQAPKDEKKGG